MTDCTGQPAEQWLEAYLAGNLPDADAQAFEEHYFDCPVCLAQVQAMQAVAGQLRRNPAQAPRPVLAWPRAIGALAAAAVLLLAAALGYRAMLHRGAPATVANHGAATAPPAAAPSPAAAFAPAQLADLALPPFRASSLRGGSEDAPFQAGMQAYAQEDCRDALRKLARVPAQSADALAARFYSGMCQMQQQEWSRAAATLRRVAAKGDSPEQEAALYYLAQISLVQGDLSAARRNLNRVVALHGDFEQRARHELDELAAHSPRK